MNRTSRFVTVGFAAFATLAGSIALAQDHKPAATGGQPAEQPQLPPGWTEADMMACMEAGTPGPMHEHLASAVGVWHGKSKMWMAPGTAAIESECTSTITSVMDGRFIQCEMEGSTPMGPFNGFGISGYDNVGQKFQSTWIDNCGTGIMFGTGDLSSDGKTMTWNYTYNCPITKKPTAFREVDRRTGKDSMVMEMFGTDPKSGKEYKMMEVAFTRQPGSDTAAVSEN